MSTSAERVAAADLLHQATALGIPWERILTEEIRAERTLRLSLADVGEDWPLWPAFSILPVSFLHSWRVRDRIHLLAWEASRHGCEAASRQLRALHTHLLGRNGGRAPDAALMAKHLWFGYQRVLVLARTRRAVNTTRGDRAERIESLRKTTGCSVDDARWALERGFSTGHVLDDAMDRTRNEGFELPRDANEVRAFRRLRSFIRTSPHLARLQSRKRARGGRAQSKPSAPGSGS